jgi:hypothetical protein
MSALLLLMVTLATFVSCGDDDDTLPGSGDITISNITIVLTGGSNLHGIEVQMRNTSTDSKTKAKTDNSGKAAFMLTPGVYEASASATVETTDYIYVYNGSLGQVVVNKGTNADVEMKLTESKIAKFGGVLIIKEVYNGGCPKNDGSGFFQQDKCIILYNNSSQRAKAANLAFAFVSPYNSHAANKWYGNDGKLVYEAENYVPALDGIWYFPDTLIVEPYSQVVVNCQGAIDNTKTYFKSVNYANQDYYCMYDPEAGYNNPNFYPTPADVIPTSHYLRAVKIGISNAWALSVFSPAILLFQTKDITPAEYGANAANMIYTPSAAQTDINKNLMIPRSWIIDGMEVFTTTSTDNVKRLTADIDAGYVSLTNKLGHVLYRNVDQKATEVLPENEGKLVYNYALGVDASTDPSGIDAEASIKNGAHILFQDTNNSTADFHERQRCSLRNEK